MTMSCAEVGEFFRQQYARALECGIDPMAIAFDPGIGFGKTLEHNLELLRNLPRLRVEDRPLVVGVSRKSFLGKVIGSAEYRDRIAPTIALTALLRERGADVLRVHDVKANANALRVTEALLESSRMIDETIQAWLDGWRGLVEIILLSVGIYYGYLYFKGTRGAKVLTGLAIVFLTLTLISQLLNLTVIGWIIRSFSVFLAVALVVIFQPELRRGLAELGGHPIFSLTSEKRETVHDIVEAITQLANKQFGALIAIERDTSIRVYEETGVTLDADFSLELMLTLFHPKSALHDGGVDHAKRSHRGRGLYFSGQPARDPRSQSRLASPRRARDYRGVGCGRGDRVRGDRAASRFATAVGSNGISLRKAFRQRINELLLAGTYDEETDSEELARESDRPAPRDNPLVLNQKERSDDTLTV